MIPAPELPARVDAIVVGAGVVGLCCAWYLRQAGLDVALIDRAAPGGATSWGNCGLIEPSHADPLTQPSALITALTTAWRRDAPLRIPLPTSLRRASWLARFAAHCTGRGRRVARSGRFELMVNSRDLLEAMISEHGLAAGYERRGLLTLYREAANFRAHRAVHDALDVGFEAIEGGPLHELPVRLHRNVQAAILTDSDGHLDPMRYGKGLTELTEAAGVRVHTGRSVDRLLVERGRVVGVSVAGRAFHARTVVLAAGPWSTDLAASAGVALPIEPARGLSITWSRPAAGHHHPIYFYERKVVLTPWADGFRVGSTLEFCGFDERVPEHRISPLLAAPAEYLHDAPDMAIDDGVRWVGFRPMCVDELPIIGPSSHLAGLFLACGHGQLGVSMSAGTGKLVADLVCGAAPAVDPGPYLPARFGA